MTRSVCSAHAGARGGSGRRAGFRFQCLMTWEFKSPRAHQVQPLRPISSGGVFIFPVRTNTETSHSYDVWLAQTGTLIGIEVDGDRSPGGESIVGEGYAGSFLPAPGTVHGPASGVGDLLGWGRGCVGAGANNLTQSPLCGGVTSYCGCETVSPAQLRFSAV